MVPHTAARRWLTLAGVILFVAMVPVWGQSPDRATPPDQDTQARILAEIRQEGKELFAQAEKNPAKGQGLAVMLLQRARQSAGNTPARYVLLTQVIELSAKAGELDQALQVIDDLEQLFVIDARSLRARAITQAAEAVQTPEQGKQVVEAALSHADECLRIDLYPLASQLGEAAETAARKAKNLPLVLAVQKERRGIAAAQRQFAQLQPFADRLQKNPDDSEANFQMGRYLALLKGEWERGLYLLAQGNEPELRRLAQRDLNRSDDWRDQLEVADDWWQRGEKEQDQIRVHLQQRAVYWYEQALGGVDAATRKRLEERIAATPRPREGLIPWDHSGKPGQIHALFGHGSTIIGVAFSSDGRKIISGCTANLAFIWDAQTGKRIHNLGGHQGLIWGVAWEPRGKHVFTASWDGFIRMWDSTTAREVRRFPSNNVRLPDINGIAVSRDGKYLLSGDDGGSLRLWEVSSGKEIRNIRAHAGLVYGVAFSPDGKQALSGGNGDGMMVLWDVHKGEAIRRIQGMGGQLRTVAFSPDGRLGIAAGEVALRLFDLKTGMEVRRFQGHVAPVRCAVFSPDGKRLATGADDGTIRLWEVASGREIHRFNIPGFSTFALAFSPGGGRLVSGSADNVVRIWGLPR